MKIKSGKLENLSSDEVNYPQFYEIRGAGSPRVNGLYSYQGICNDRPYYVKDDTAALWYFQTRVFPSSYWCGWYLSKSVLSSLLFVFISRRSILKAPLLQKIFTLHTLMENYLHQRDG
jgi:hypothetical protein